MSDFSNFFRLKNTIEQKFFGAPLIASDDVKMHFKITTTPYEVAINSINDEYALFNPNLNKISGREEIEFYKDMNGFLYLNTRFFAAALYYIHFGFPLFGNEWDSVYKTILSRSESKNLTENMCKIQLYTYYVKLNTYIDKKRDEERSLIESGVLEFKGESDLFS